MTKGQAHFDNLLVTNSQTARSLYALGNQTIATRVTGDPTATNNGLFYLFSDHLGNTSALTYGNGGQIGTEIPGSRARYYPFGSPRTAPTQTITDRNFTGQKENMELGLIYYNARFYLPTISRFLTPDTLIPNPQSPQSFNRYSYVLNSPLNFTDPAGHFSQNAIRKYIQQYECANAMDVDDCVFTALSWWQENQVWWDFLSKAKAGDQLYGQTCSQLACWVSTFTFLGKGSTQLTGISSGDVSNEFNLIASKLLRGKAEKFPPCETSACLYSPLEFTWGALATHDENGNLFDIYLRPSETVGYVYNGDDTLTSMTTAGISGAVGWAVRSGCLYSTGGALSIACAGAGAATGAATGALLNPLHSRLQAGDLVVVSAGHIFVYHGIPNWSNYQENSQVIISYFGDSSHQDPIWQLIVDFK